MKSKLKQNAARAAAAALALACAPVVAFAQSAAAVREQAGALPETVMLDVPMPLFRTVKTVHNIKPSPPWGMPQMERLRIGLLADDQLDERERELLAEFQKPFFHVRLVALKTPVFAPADLVLAGAFTAEARAELAKFAPLEGRAQRSLWLDANAEGWKKAVAYARQGDEQREEIIDLLVEKLQEAASRSTLQNSYTPFRDRLNGFHNVAGTQRGPDNEFARITLLRTAAELTYDSGRSTLSAFMVDWIKRGSDEVVVLSLPPDFVAGLRAMAASKPFPWGHAEAEKLAALLRQQGELSPLFVLLVKTWMKPKFRMHLGATSLLPGVLDTLDLDGSFEPGATAVLRPLIPPEKPEKRSGQ